MLDNIISWLLAPQEPYSHLADIILIILGTIWILFFHYRLVKLERQMLILLDVMIQDTRQLNEQRKEFEAVKAAGKKLNEAIKEVVEREERGG